MYVRMLCLSEKTETFTIVFAENDFTILNRVNEYLKNLIDFHRKFGFSRLRKNTCLVLSNVLFSKIHYTSIAFYTSYRVYT